LSQGGFELARAAESTAETTAIAEIVISDGAGFADRWILFRGKRSKVVIE
jgi:hypothetical protein